jgi:hypothetical protein
VPCAPNGLPARPKHDPTRASGWSGPVTCRVGSCSCRAKSCGPGASPFTMGQIFRTTGHQCRANHRGAMHTGVHGMGPPSHVRDHNPSSTLFSPCGMPVLHSVLCSILVSSYSTPSSVVPSSTLSLCRPTNPAPCRLAALSLGQPPPSTSSMVDGAKPPTPPPPHPNLIVGASPPPLTLNHRPVMRRCPPPPRRVAATVSALHHHLRL